MAVKRDVVTEPKMPQRWKKHLLQDSTSTPKTRTPQLLKCCSRYHRGQPAILVPSDLCCFSRSLAYMGKVQPRRNATDETAASHLLTDSGRVPLQHGELFSCSCIPDLYKALVSANGYQVPLDKQKTMIVTAQKYRQTTRSQKLRKSLEIGPPRWKFYHPASSPY